MSNAVFRVTDAYDHPHGGRVLRLRLWSGRAPSVKALKNEVLTARSPKGDETRFRVSSFAVFGGRPSDARLSRTGRADVMIEGEGARQVDAGWEVATGSA